jgi:murein DD-endopeptidase MepM/ murein hydrolase activator NlpD
MNNGPVAIGPATPPGVTSQQAKAVAEGRPEDREKLKLLASEFEAMMLNNMLRGMRQSMLGEEEEGGLGSDTMTATFDQELALTLSRARGFGLAQQLLGSLDKRAQAVAAAKPALVPGPPLAGEPEEGPAMPAAAVFPDRHDSETDLRSATGGLGALSSSYGIRQDPFGRGLRFHSGVDIAAAYGREVPAAGAGRVVEAGDHGAYGNTVVVEHQGGVQTRYAHLSALNVTIGQDVAAGQVIGRVGQSGRATGPHLHFEVLEGGKPVNPGGIAERFAGALKSLGQVVDLSHE